MSLRGKLMTLSVVMRHNPVTPGSPASQGSIDQDETQPSPPMYTGLANMVSVKCGAGCANLDNLLLVCGKSLIANFNIHKYFYFNRIYYGSLTQIFSQTHRSQFACCLFQSCHLISNSTYILQFHYCHYFIKA